MHASWQAPAEGWHSFEDASRLRECASCSTWLNVTALLGGTVAFALILVSAHFELTLAVVLTIGLPIGAAVLYFLSLTRTVNCVPRCSTHSTDHAQPS
jgi:hypothetical protein